MSKLLVKQDQNICTADSNRKFTILPLHKVHMLPTLLGLVFLTIIWQCILSGTFVHLQIHTYSPLYSDLNFNTVVGIAKSSAEKEKENHKIPIEYNETQGQECIKILYISDLKQLVCTKRYFTL